MSMTSLCNRFLLLAVLILLAFSTITVAQSIPGFTVTPFATGIAGARQVSTDPAGNVYSMGRNNGIVYKISPSGVIHIIANLGSSHRIGPYFDSVSGDLIVSTCRTSGSVFRINNSGSVSTLTSGLRCPAGFTSDAAGNIYASEFVSGGGVVKITPSGIVSPYGTGLSIPDGINFGPGGELYVTNRFAGTILRVPPGGGTAAIFASGFNVPLDVIFDNTGNGYVANFGNGTISKVSPAGVVSTFGTGFTNPDGLAFDPSGNLFIADFGSGVIYKVVGVSAPANRLPIANAGPDQTNAECISSSTQVTLDGTGSSDPDSDPFTFSWSAPGIIFDDSTSATPTAVFPLETTTVTLVVNDGTVDSEPVTVGVTVADTTAPTISAEFVPLSKDDDSDSDRQVIFPQDGDENDDGRSRLKFSATDACDAAPQVTGAIETPSLDGLDVELKTKQKVKVEFDLKKGKVKIEGPDPEALLAQLQDQGGLVVDSGQSVRIKLKDQLKFKFEFKDDGELLFEGPNTNFKVSAADASGNTTVVEISPNLVPEENDEDNSKVGIVTVSIELSVSTILVTPNPVENASAVEFLAQGTGIQDISVELFNLAGQRIYESGAMPGNALRWTMLNNDGGAVANGVYLYVVTVRGFNGEVLRSQVKKLVVLR